jgi:putative RecB family exonuclease
MRGQETVPGEVRPVPAIYGGMNMTFDDLKQLPHLSASGIRDYLECGLLYKLSRIDRQPPAFRNDTFEFGKAIHLTLAEFYQAKQQGKKQPLEQLLVSFEFFWRHRAEDQDDIRYGKGKNFSGLLDEGKELLKAYYDELPPDNFKVLAIEKPFWFELPDLDIPIIGIFDLVEEDDAGTIIITDWKTSSRAYSNADIDKHLQMTLYHLAARTRGGKGRNLLLRIDCLVKTKKPRLEQYYTSRTTLDEQRLLKKIKQVHYGIQQGVFVPNDNSWRCGTCAYQIYCNDWFNQ